LFNFLLENTAWKTFEMVLVAGGGGHMAHNFDKMTQSSSNCRTGVT
jgi:hypothetical protein